METIDNNINSISTELEFNTRELLKTAGKWGRFIAILGFIGCGLMLLGGIGVLAAGARISGMGSETPLIVIIYLLVGLLYFVPTLYLYRFSVAAINTGNSGSPEDLHETALHLKKLFKFIGILTIIIISIYLLIFIGAMLFAASMRF